MYAVSSFRPLRFDRYDLDNSCLGVPFRRVHKRKQHTCRNDNQPSHRLVCYRRTQKVYRLYRSARGWGTAALSSTLIATAVEYLYELNVSRKRRAQTVGHMAVCEVWDMTSYLGDDDAHFLSFSARLPYSETTGNTVVLQKES